MNVSRTTVPAASIASTATPSPGVHRAPSRPESRAGRPLDAAPPSAGLWNLLTPEEQAFFAQQATGESLTYGPRSSSSGARDAASPSRGARIDLRG